MKPLPVLVLALSLAAGFGLATDRADAPESFVPGAGFLPAVSNDGQLDSQLEFVLDMQRWHPALPPQQTPSFLRPALCLGDCLPPGAPARPTLSYPY